VGWGAGIRLSAINIAAATFLLLSVIPAFAQAAGGGAQGGAPPPDAGTPALKPAEDLSLPAINVVGVTPVMGTGIPLNQVPANVQSFNAQQIEDSDHPYSILDALNYHMGSVTLSNTEGNPFQQDLNFRGFTASPVLGTPQGLAIYQNGVRINEPFGDVIFWDLVPMFAINKMQVIPGSDPVFGLNALGGAITMEMKNGFNFQGAQLDLSGGSFGRRQAVGEYGLQVGNLAGYSGLEPSDLVQSFSDFAVRGDNFDFGVSLTLAATALYGQGTDPAQELDIDRTAVFTYPDQARNRLVFFQGRGNYELTDQLSLQGIAYFRHSGIRTSNGDTSGFGECAAPSTALCDAPGALEATDALFPLGGTIPIPFGSAPGPGYGSGILGIQRTITDGFGTSVQATYDQPIFDLKNSLIAGASFDLGSVKFNNITELATLYPIGDIGYGTSPTGILLDTPDYNTLLDSVNRYYGLFGTDTLALTNALSATLSGRVNLAQVVLSDHLGEDAGALDGNHHYTHFNPAFGLTYQFNKELTVYGNIGQSNRIPTAAELACSDPTQPCRFPAGFVSDPNLKQVVATTVEVGARGDIVRPVAGNDLGIEWSADVYGAQNQNDIIFVASGPFIGSGYFDNAGDTRRLGGELNLDGKWQRLDFHASYGFVKATFQSNFAILSPNNPGADVNGNIYIKPGDRLPNIPLNSFKAGIGYQITDHWHAGFDFEFASSQYLTGDEANLQKQLPGYGVVNFKTSYDITKWCQVYFVAENLLNHKYDSFGIYGDPTGDGAFPQFTDPRNYTPAPPFGFWVGVKFRL
jgi:iron complex outermembrane receptor protein